MNDNDRLINIKEVVAMTHVSKSTIYRWIRLGLFPGPFRIGVRAVRWWESEVRAWLAKRPRATGDLDDPTNGNVKKISSVWPL